jgi:hypothetical protein
LFILDLPSFYNEDNYYLDKNKMTYFNQTNEESCLSPLDSARFIMERSKHVSIDIPALQKLSNIV